MKISDSLNEIEPGLSAPLFDGIVEDIANYQSIAPGYPDITSTEYLKDSARVIEYLSEIDWSFTADDTSFLTHDLHPYPTKYIPQIPGHLISILSQRGELVFDPFGGSGTTALEAVRLGRRAISIDANPIGTIIGKVKTCNLDQTAITDLHAIRCVLASRINDLPNDARALSDEYGSFIPEIPNIDKWFPLTSRGELALIKSRVESIENETAKNIARLALSRIILKVSFQDSETRYSSKPREIPSGETIKRFLLTLGEIIQNVKRTQPVLRYGVCDFITADIRELDPDVVKDESVDLVVTSPPYGNAMDFHLYHRFRLLWLGYDPRKLARIEIGSHLRHQKESTGFDGYLSEMTDSMRTMFRVIKPGRYSVLVIGDAIYNKVLYKGAESLGERAEKVGFEKISIIERQIHRTKRSFISAGRRATTEKLLVLRKPAQKIMIRLGVPPYKLWSYERTLRSREIHRLLGKNTTGNSSDILTVSVDPYQAINARKLVFTHSIGYSESTQELSWQAIIENGFAGQSSSRKDPKYVTHGLHPYKGKFYPQLAKGLINLCGLNNGAQILDPFCGSGTTLLEGYLNGYRARGCDMHPLAAKIARAKVGILDVNPDVLSETVSTLFKKIEQAPTKYEKENSQFDKDCMNEVARWFPLPVINKLNWILKIIRGVSDGIIRDFLEVVLSSIIREISHQDPNDLRIRKRKLFLEDAEVFSLFIERLEMQYQRIEKFWSARGYSLNNFYTSKAIAGDSRNWTSFEKMGITEESVDLVLTSPPYATALPYIDTDRLSLLILFGLNSSKRRPFEQNLVGSREINITGKKRLEEILIRNEANLPESVMRFLTAIHHRVSAAKVGFRRKNMPALLLRFFQDINKILSNCFRALKYEGQAMIVIGDNRIKIDSDYERIPTTDLVEEIAEECGFKPLERIDISVTKENYLHIKNAITENVVLRLKRP